MTLFANQTAQVSNIKTNAIVRNLLELQFQAQGIERDSAALANQLVENSTRNIENARHQPHDGTHQLTLALLALLEGLNLPLEKDETVVIIDALGSLLRDLKSNHNTYQLKLLDAVMLENANRRIRETQRQADKST